MNLQAQSGPTITTQPTNQTNLAGTRVAFSVAVDGPGPFAYQWRFNGTNLPSNIISTLAGNGYRAGTGYGGYSGDGSPAICASLYFPMGLTWDAAGNLYIADSSNNRIRKMDVNGIITTVAGNGTAGYSGDGGAATNASLHHPQGVAVDASGNLNIADTENNRLRKVDAHGIITTVAGNGNSDYSGDDGAATNASLSAWSVAVGIAGELYVADYVNSRVRRVDTDGIIRTVAGNGSPAFAGDGGAATNASLNRPLGVALDGLRNLYITELDNSRVRRVDPNGIITTVAGNGSYGYSGDGGAATNASLDWPWGLGSDEVGNVYIADSMNTRVRKVDLSGVITTVAGNGSYGFSGDGGLATKALLHSPEGVAFDAIGNLYVADTVNNVVRKVLLYGTYPTLTLPNVSGTNAGDYSVVITNAYGSVTSAVVSLTVEAPPIITGQPVSQALVLGSSAVFSLAVAGSGPFAHLWYFAATNLVQSGASASLTIPNISATNAGPYTVVATNAWGSVTSQVATLTVLFPPSVITPPASQTVIAGTNVSFTVTAAGTGPLSYQWRLDGTNFPNNIITTVAGNGSTNYVGEGGPATSAGLYFPDSLAFDVAGNLFIADHWHHRIRKVDARGTITTVAGNGTGAYAGDGGPATNASLNGPTGVALDASGNLYIADGSNNRIRIVGTTGTITTVAGNGIGAYAGDGGPATNASLNTPGGLALDALGNLYIADWLNHRVRKLATSGNMTTVAGNGIAAYAGDGGAATSASLRGPEGVTVDPWGNLYIADSYNHCVRVVQTNGIITTVAGNGLNSYSSDGGAATNASLNTPSGVVLDTSGGMIIADFFNNRIRRVDSNGVITTIAGNGIKGYSGDGGAPTNASIQGPTSVALDPWGYLYFSDMYNNRIRKLPLPGTPTLSIANAGADEAGNYTVVISNPYGSVTSVVAVLTVTIPRTPPQIVTGDASFGVLSNRFGFNLSGAFGQTIVVDGSTNLVDWLLLGTSTMGSSLIYFSDPGWTNFPWRYYRARLQ